MVTSREIAQRFGVSNSTARGWLLRGRFAGAELRESELGQPYWVAPEVSVKSFVPPRPGPVPQAKTGTSSGQDGRVIVTKKRGAKK